MNGHAFLPALRYLLSLSSPQGKALRMKKSISAKGNGIHSADQLGSSHLMAIVHGAYRKVVPLKELKHEVDIITHMFLTQNLAPGDFMKGRADID